MDKLRLRLGVSGVLSAMALVFLTAAAVQAPAVPEAAAAPAAAIAAADNGSAGSGQYLLRNCGDYVGVFDRSGGRDTLVTVTDIPLAGLRAQDREALEQGIAVESREELLLLLEDFGS